MNSDASQMTSSKNGNDSMINWNGKANDAVCGRLSLEHFATAYYGPFLQKTPVKVSHSYS